ncbi:hypothetical protein U3516DRAFT_665711 [Neocallimastix sp. 'constans']
MSSNNKDTPKNHNYQTIDNYNNSNNNNSNLYQPMKNPVKRGRAYSSSCIDNSRINNSIRLNANKYVSPAVSVTSIFTNPITGLHHKLYHSRSESLHSNNYADFKNSLNSKNDLEKKDEFRASPNLHPSSSSQFQNNKSTSNKPIQTISSSDNNSIDSYKPIQFKNVSSKNFMTKSQVENDVTIASSDIGSYYASSHGLTNVRPKSSVSYQFDSSARTLTNGLNSGSIALNNHAPSINIYNSENYLTSHGTSDIRKNYSTAYSISSNSTILAPPKKYLNNNFSVYSYPKLSQMLYIVFVMLFVFCITFFGSNSTKWIIIDTRLKSNSTNSNNESIIHYEFGISKYCYNAITDNDIGNNTDIVYECKDIESSCPTFCTSEVACVSFNPVGDGKDFEDNLVGEDSKDPEFSFCNLTSKSRLISKIFNFLNFNIAVFTNSSNIDESNKQDEQLIMKRKKLLRYLFSFLISISFIIGILGIYFIIKWVKEQRHIGMEYKINKFNESSIELDKSLGVSFILVTISSVMNIILAIYLIVLLLIIHFSNSKIYWNNVGEDDLSSQSFDSLHPSNSYITNNYINNYSSSSYNPNTFKK